MVDNFDQIDTFITQKEVTDDTFYFLQIIKRKKENPEQNKNARLVDVFYIKDGEDLQGKKDRIVELCKIHNARAYIHLNKRNKKKVALETLALISRNIANDNYNIENCYHSCCGQYSKDEDKTWVIDVDTKDQNYVRDLIKIIEQIRPFGKKKALTIIPTKNGYHIITRPFDIQEWRGYMRGWLEGNGFKQTDLPDIHKDNPTILYTT